MPSFGMDRSAPEWNVVVLLYSRIRVTGGGAGGGGDDDGTRAAGRS